MFLYCVIVLFRSRDHSPKTKRPHNQILVWPLPSLTSWS